MPGNARADAFSAWSALEAEYLRYQKIAPVIPLDQLRVQEDLRRYLCLRCAGFLEQVTFITIRGYLEQKSSGPTFEFSLSWFKRAPNLTATAFRQLIARFGQEHEAAFSEFLTPVLKESLDDLLSIRNDVAHGKKFEGAKLAPARYMTLCEAVHGWMVETFLGDSVQVLRDDGKTGGGYERTPS